MNASLSMVLPLHQAEMAIAENIQHIFEVVSDLTEQFQVLVVGKNWNEVTEELALDLSVRYPQVRLVRDSWENATASICSRDSSETPSQVVFLVQPNGRLSANSLRQLWDWHLGSCQRNDIAKSDANDNSRNTFDTGVCEQEGVATSEVTELGGIRMFRLLGVSRALRRDAAHVTTLRPTTYSTNLALNRVDG